MQSQEIVSVELSTYEELPIVFIHRGRGLALPLALMQAYHFNPYSPIYLIGDSTYPGFPFVTSVALSDFQSDLDELDQVYVHLSPNTRAFELFCIQRWFVLRRFMQREGIQRCVHLDSDVLTYCNFTEEAVIFQHNTVALSDYCCPQVMFINSLDTLDRYCQMVLDTYTSYRNDGIERCDMTFFLDQVEVERSSWGDLSVILDGAVFDGMISGSQGFEMERERPHKKIHWNNNIPYGRRIDSEELVRFKSLHFQGAAKPFIGDFYRLRLRM